MAGESDHCGIGCRENKECDRDVDQHRSKNDKVVEVWTYQTNDPAI